MRHHVRVTVLEKKCFCDLQRRYLADPASGPCGVFEVGDTFEFVEIQEKARKLEDTGEYI